MRMLGRKGKPFCDQCCAEFRPGSGKAHKRIGKHREKRREAREVRREVEAR